MSAESSALALEAGDPTAFDSRPEFIKAVAGDPTYAWATTAWDAAYATDGAWFDYELADAIVEAWPTWARLTVDRFAGEPFYLGDWQEIIVRLLVGWKIPTEQKDGRTRATKFVPARLFRRLMLWVPRKNGKSEFLAALALMFFVLDGVARGEGYVFARKEDQARIVFNRMSDMIAKSAMLKREVIVNAKVLFVPALPARFELLTGSEAGVHGKSPSVIVGDEMHEWKSLVIPDTLRQGTGGRLQPIELYASTAGRKSGGHSAGEQLYEETRAIVDRVRSDAATLAVIFAAEDDDDPALEDTWRKANPNLGLSPSIQFMRGELARAAGNPRKMAEFKCYHLGIWADQVSRWLPLKKWDACAESRHDWPGYAEALKGRLCYAAFDVSSTTDVTAMVLVFPPTDDDPKWRALCRFWIPEDKVAERRAEGAPVDQLIGIGAMETTEGDCVDQNVVGRAIQEADRDYDVQRWGFDPWNARKLVTDLQTAGAIPDSDAPPMDAEIFCEMRQGILTLGEPSKHFERLVFAEEFDHGGHPTLRWMAGNTVIQFDRNLNFMPAKNKSADKIDGIVACVMAVGLAMTGEVIETSPWEDPDYKLARA